MLGPLFLSFPLDSFYTVWNRIFPARSTVYRKASAGWFRGTPPRSRSHLIACRYHLGQGTPTSASPAASPVAPAFLGIFMDVSRHALLQYR